MGKNKGLKENLTKNLQSVNAWFEKNHPNILRMDKDAWKNAFSELLPNVNDFLRTYSIAKNRQGEDIDSFKSYNEALIDALNLTWDTSEGYIGNISYQRNKQRVEECIKNIFDTDSITEEVKTIAHILISINQLSPQKLSIREQQAIGRVYSTIAFEDDKNMDEGNQIQMMKADY